MRRTAIVIALAALACACRDQAKPVAREPVEPPVESPNAIPDAPISGNLHGKPFVLRDARYVVDKRVGYAHTDLKLSSGTAEAACGPVSPNTATSVWLRLEGDAPIEARDTKLGAGQEGGWSVHYQVFDGEAWVGVGEGSALLSIRDIGPDGRIEGGLAVCFADGMKSCVSGSFVAASCPPTIDQPVRGRPPPEAMPASATLKIHDAGK